MPGKRTSMRKIRQVLRLSWSCGLSRRKVAQSCGMGSSTVGDYIDRAKSSGLSWEEVEGMDDGQLERLLFPSFVKAAKNRPLPDWREIHTELKRNKSVTLMLLWEEYKEANPEGLEYSRFCDLYREWKGTLEACMRQEHRAGEKLFVDYSGKTIDVVDRSTGEVREAEIFVAVLGASNYTYAEATWTQGLEDWIGAHRRTFEYIGGLTELVVPDNLKSGVSRPCRYEPDENPTYHEMAEHYGTAILPARVRKPRDKAKVEAGVLLVQRWILARLRKRTFFSLAEVNRAISELLKKLNERPLRVVKQSRRELFEALDRPALRPLPRQPYELAEWKKCRVAPDYHVEVDGHFYSVPYQLLKKEIDARATDTTVECFYKGKSVAVHARSFLKGRHTTLPEHMPAAHRAYADWTPRRLIRWAENVGPGTAKTVEAIMAARAHPQQGFRSCLGLLRLGKSYGNDRLEKACLRALEIKSTSYKSVKSILKSNLDRQPPPEPEQAMLPIEHDNIRGPEYFG